MQGLVEDVAECIEFVGANDKKGKMIYQPTLKVPPGRAYDGVMGLTSVLLIFRRISSLRFYMYRKALYGSATYGVEMRRKLV